MEKQIRFDWALKRLLRDKANFVVLEGFLTSLLGKRVRIDRILESESNVEEAENKSNRVDILAENDEGEKILIEVQNQSEDSYFHRMLFGTSRLISEYLKRGDTYDKVAKVFAINIVYFDLGVGDDYVYVGRTEFHGLHDNSLLRLPERWKRKFDVEEVSDLYPVYYILKADDFDRFSKTPLDQWMYFLSQGVVHEDSDAPGLREAREKLRVDNLSKEERDAYFRYLDNMNSMRSIVDTARQDAAWENRQIGFNLGIEKGEQIGLAKGEQIGLAKGEQIGLEKGLSMSIKKMLQAGMTPSEISNILEVPLSDIESIRQ